VTVTDSETVAVSAVLPGVVALVSAGGGIMAGAGDYQLLTEPLKNRSKAGDL
jgi:hypothetical protein